MSQDLESARLRLDAIDRELLRLLNDRMKIALDIVRAKRESGLPVFDGGREDLVLERLARRNEGPLSRDGLRRIWSAVFAESRIHQALSATGSAAPAEAGEAPTP
ncbi:MAG: chorismate mutase [Fibrobacteria bacterium]|nr:chorismate mutase [Fibrobacteria bacterium]